MVKLQGDFYFSFDTSTKRSEQPQGDFFARIALQREYNGKTSVYFYYKISVFQTAIVKGRNRNSYEYKNCITDPYFVLSCRW
jgi:hypothetical protein